MIPKLIHYCWFGRNPKPALADKCIKSWKKYCPDFEIIEWNEDNFDISAAPLYVRQAYEAKKWAFVTDYVRLKVVYNHGGIYMDTDVELKKPLTPLLANHAYFGFEDGIHVNTGLGFGAEAGTAILAEMMADYENIPYIREDGTFDKATCPERNIQVFLRHGLIQDDSRQILDGDILILPSIYLCPISFETGVHRYSLKTISIHHFSASWSTKEQKESHIKWRRAKRKYMAAQKLDMLVHTPNRALRFVLGTENYERLKQILKKGK